MNRFGHGRLRRIAAEVRGDEAVAIDILEVSLRMGEVARTRVETDTMLVRLALKALDSVIAQCCLETGSRYPSAYETALGKWPDIRQKSGHMQNDDDSGTASPR